MLPLTQGFTAESASGCATSEAVMELIFGEDAAPAVLIEVNTHFIWRAKVETHHHTLQALKKIQLHNVELSKQVWEQNVQIEQLSANQCKWVRKSAAASEILALKETEIWQLGKKFGVMNDIWIEENVFRKAPADPHITTAERYRNANSHLLGSIQELYDVIPHAFHEHAMNYNQFVTMVSFLVFLIPPSLLTLHPFTCY